MQGVCVHADALSRMFAVCGAAVARRFGATDQRLHGRWRLHDRCAHAEARQIQMAVGGDITAKLIQVGLIQLQQPVDRALRVCRLRP